MDDPRAGDPPVAPPAAPEGGPTRPARPPAGDGEACPRAAPRPGYGALGLVLLLITLAGLFYYKWAGSLATVEGVRSTGAWTRSAASITGGGAFAATAAYFERVWIALVLGVLIGAAVRAAVSPRWVATLLGGGGTARAQLAGGLAGAPLMLCSCCVTPIFTSVYERGGRLGPSLAVMLASPGLNLAALVLTFLLFPADLALARLATALAIVLLVPPLVERWLGLGLRPPAPSPEAADDGPRDARDLLTRFARSAAYLTVVTVPLIGVGVVASSLLLPLGLQASPAGAAATVLLVATIAVFAALPTFFEIPLALALLEAGAPGAATAMLVAGPIVNLPSLLVLGRETNARVAVALAGGVWLLAVGAGLLTA